MPGPGPGRGPICHRHGEPGPSSESDFTAGPQPRGPGGLGHVTVTAAAPANVTVIRRRCPGQCQAESGPARESEELGRSGTRSLNASEECGRILRQARSLRLRASEECRTLRAAARLGNRSDPFPARAAGARARRHDSLAHDGH